jgi:hypothetical protein
MILIRLLKNKNGVMGKYVFGLVFLLSWMSCGEDVDIFIPRTNQDVGGDISRLTTKLKQDIAGDIQYSVSCPCFGDYAFEFDKDLVLVIPSQFVDIAQYPCLTGFYQLDVTVCDTKGEILIAGIPTISEKKLLESRIEFDFDIKNGDDHVALAHGKQIRVLVKDPDPRDRMELFYGNNDNSEWIQADDNLDTWDNVGSTEWWIQQDSSGGNPIQGFGYEAFSDSTDWINVDVFSSVPAEQRTTVCVELPEEFTNTNAEVFMVFQDYKSVVRMHGDTTLKQFCEPYGSTPLGYRVTFVVIGEQGEGNYYFATKDAVITPNLTETIVPKRTPYEEIKNYILQL